jgi:hypothetical protein
MSDAGVGEMEVYNRLCGRDIAEEIRYYKANIIMKYTNISLIPRFTFFRDIHRTYISLFPENRSRRFEDVSNIGYFSRYSSIIIRFSHYLLSKINSIDPSQGWNILPLAKHTICKN